MKKIERLLNLVSALLDAEKPLSRQSIRERIPGAYSENDESFRRTFERDKDELRALGIPIPMFTVLFAIGRLPGWIAHWMEMHGSENFRICRPRQVYTGSTERAVVPISERG